MMFTSAKIKLLRAPRGSTPFYRVGTQLYFSHQNGRLLEWGVAFTPAIGYRAYFRFQNVQAANTFVGEALKEWCLGLSPADGVERALKIEGVQLAETVIAKQAEWLAQGKPTNLFCVVGAA